MTSADGAPVVVDLFAGPGGWDVAAQQLGLAPIGVEWDDAACQTARAAGHVRYREDVAALDPWAFVSSLVGEGAPAWGLIASPPCQAFSLAGKGRGRLGAAVLLDGVARIGAGEDPRTVCKAVDDALDDDRAALVLEPLRWALELEPTWIALEQVPPVLPLWEAMADVLRADGWNTDTGLLSAEQYDVPQTRRRAFLIAHREHAVQLPAPVRRRYRKGVAQDQQHRLDDPSLAPWISMADALGWGGSSVLSNYSTGGDTSRRGSRASEEPAATVTSHVNRNLWQLRNNDMGRAAVRTTDQPAPTLTADKDYGSRVWQRRNSGPGAAREPRPVADPSYTVRANGSGSHPSGVEWQDDAARARVSVAEAAALQGFPDDYPWQGSTTAQYRQVGDAVPPPLALHVLRAAIGGGA